MNLKKHLLSIALTGALIVALVHYLLPGGWGWMSGASHANAAAESDWATTLVSVPVWLLAFMWALLVTAVGGVVMFAFARRRTLDIPIAPSATVATIFGVKWRWSYHDGKICDIAAYCPKCDVLVRPAEETRHGFLHLISYRCACRKWQSKSFQCSQGAMLNRVRHAIAQQSQKNAVAA